MRMRGKWNGPWSSSEKSRLTLPPHSPEIVQRSCASLFVQRLMLRQSHSMYEGHSPNGMVKSGCSKNIYSDSEASRRAALAGNNESIWHGWAPAVISYWYSASQSLPFVASSTCFNFAFFNVGGILLDRALSSQACFSPLFFLPDGFALGHDTFLRAFGS